MIGGVVSNWDVKDFQPIACESFPVLSGEALCDVSIMTNSTHTRRVENRYPKK